MGADARAVCHTDEEGVSVHPHSVHQHCASADTIEWVEARVRRIRNECDDLLMTLATIKRREAQERRIST